MNKPNISTPSQLSANVFEQLISPIDAFVQQQNADYFHHHNEKLSYAAFFRLLMYYFSTPGESFKVFINTELNRGLVPSNLNLPVTPYTTVSEAFGRFPVAWFQSAYQHLLDTQPLKQIPELAALGTLCCVDGSLFPVINSMQWAEYTSKQQSLKLHLSFELNRMVKCEFWVTSANTSERKMLIKMAKQDTTYIADRGYMSFKVAHQLLQAQAHFIFRVKANLKYQVQKSLPVALPKHVQDLFENVTDEIIRYDNDSFEHTYRLVTFRAFNEFFLILTDREDLSTYEIIMLYAYRWQVELLFRFEKRTMNGIHLIKQDKQGVTIQFYAMLIMALLQLRLKQLSMTMLQTEVGTAQNSEQDQTEPLHHSLLAMLGSQLKHFWKIGIHWLTALRKLLDKPFDMHAIAILGDTLAIFIPFCIGLSRFTA